MHNSSHTKYNIFSFIKNLPDKNKTDLHRFKPISSLILIGEQPYHLKQMHFMDINRRHRGDKQKCSFERLIFIILLSQEYLLSVKCLVF